MMLFHDVLRAAQQELLEDPSLLELFRKGMPAITEAGLEETLRSWRIWDVISSAPDGRWIAVDQDENYDVWKMICQQARTKVELSSWDDPVHGYGDLTVDTVQTGARLLSFSYGGDPGSGSLTTYLLREGGLPANWPAAAS